MFGFWMRYLHYGWAHPDGNPHLQDSCSNLSISVFWKEILKLGRTLSVVRTCYWNVRTDASWNSSKLLDIEEGPDGKFSSSGRMMLWTIWRPDGISRRPDCWQGTRFFWLVDCAESSESTLNSGIPVKKHHYKEVILSNKMWPITN
jgi:hypothetical protein